MALAGFGLEDVIDASAKAARIVLPEIERGGDLVGELEADDAR